MPKIPRSEEAHALYARVMDYVVSNLDKVETVTSNCNVPFDPEEPIGWLSVIARIMTGHIHNHNLDEIADELRSTGYSVDNIVFHEAVVTWMCSRLIVRGNLTNGRDLTIEIKPVSTKSLRKHELDQVTKAYTMLKKLYKLRTGQLSPDQATSIIADALALYTGATLKAMELEARLKEVEEEYKKYRREAEERIEELEREAESLRDKLEMCEALAKTLACKVENERPVQARKR